MPKEYPVQYAGKISFLRRGIDIGPLEAHSESLNFIREMEIEKNVYNCHYAISDDGQRIDAMMVVSNSYESDVLEAKELFGSFSVGLSGVVGFFSSPKKDYTMYQLGEYLKQLDRSHYGRAWYELNTKQFIAPCSQGPATNVNVYVHRNTKGEIDAIQIEFNRKETELMMEAANDE